MGKVGGNKRDLQESSVSAAFGLQSAVGPVPLIKAMIGKATCAVFVGSVGCGLAFGALTAGKGVRRETTEAPLQQPSPSPKRPAKIGTTQTRDALSV